MTIDDWVYEAIEKGGKAGATIREIQRYIDEHHYEELALDTIEASLIKLNNKEKIRLNVNHWQTVQKTSKEDALKKLFGTE